MDVFRNLSLKNKIFISTLAFILLLSVVIALFTRWILIGSLTSELELRGIGIAKGVADNCNEYILTENRRELTNLIFDARLGERKYLVNYIFITDKEKKVLAHTFTVDFPESLTFFIRESHDQVRESELISVFREQVYHISVSIKEGIYEIGRVHIGLNKNHIDQLIGKLRITFLGFLSLVTIIFFLISLSLSKYITRPISKLIKLSDRISHGDFQTEMEPEKMLECMKNGKCRKNVSPAGDYFDECLKCDYYKESVKDEVGQLRDSFINMTQHIKKSQDNLKVSEEKYKSLFAGGPNPVFVCDRHTLEIIDANPAAEDLFGYSSGELKQIKITDLGHFDPEKTDLIRMDHNSDQRAVLVHYKEQYSRKDGTPLFVNIHMGSTFYKNRDAMVIAASDITEIVEKDSLLIQASKMTGLGKMSAGIAHELNQPLNAIKMGSEFLQFMHESSDTLAEDQLYKISIEISEQVDRAADIINRLKEFGRKADFLRENVNLNLPVLSVIQLMEKQLGLQNIWISRNFDKTLPEIEAHKNRIEQVVFNLVTNARDAINQLREVSDSDNRGWIEVATEFRNSKVILVVRDNGIGISSDIRGRIFETFFTTKQMGEGMGMGLSIINGIVKDYHGDIEIISERSQGAEFRISFPVAKDRLKNSAADI